MSSSEQSFQKMYLVSHQMFDKLLSIATPEERQVLIRLNPEFQPKTASDPLQSIAHLLRK